jgi:hypothetical protein
LYSPLWTRRQRFPDVDEIAPSQAAAFTLLGKNFNDIQNRRGTRCDNRIRGEGKVG